MSDYIVEVEVDPETIVEVFVDTTEVVEVFEASFGAAGPSNYQLAVANGYGGTEQEWLDSFVTNVDDLRDDLNSHVQAPRPHEQAESGRDFGAWLDALTA